MLESARRYQLILVKQVYPTFGWSTHYENRSEVNSLDNLSAYNYLFNSERLEKHLNRIEKLLGYLKKAYPCVRGKF